MKSPVRAFRGEPILVDRAAHTFGSFREVFSIRSRIRGNGVLTLTDDRLTFEQADTETIGIPLEDIQRLGMGQWHRGGAEFVPVLKITYSGNLVFGVHVSNPERWIDAIEDLASGQGHETVVDKQRLPQLGFRHSRVLIILFFLVLLLSVILPILFSLIQTQTGQDQAVPPPPTDVSTGTTG